MEGLIVITIFMVFILLALVAVFQEQLAQTQWRQKRISRKAYLYHIADYNKRRKQK